MPTTAEIISLRKPQPKAPLLYCISERFSPRVFSPESIPADHLSSIFEAARLTPSSRNHQPWLFLWTAKGTPAYDRLMTCVPDRNAWCRSAPLIIMATYTPLDPLDTPNRWAQYDLGAAVMSLILQAQELGYYTRQIGSFDWKKAKELFADQLGNYEPFVLLPLGKIGTYADYVQADPAIIAKDFQPSGRKEIIAFELV